mmetsp:Transcript_68438/g.164321  ORF Transcript_68438/g.164321 Transcript_68438/m.164321 type:complete len:248 (-) Transcript_68438:192-935(-)
MYTRVTGCTLCVWPQAQANMHGDPRITLRSIIDCGKALTVGYFSVQNLVHDHSKREDVSPLIILVVIIEIEDLRCHPPPSPHTSSHRCSRCFCICFHCSCKSKVCNLGHWLLVLRPKYPCQQHIATFQVAMKYARVLLVQIPHARCDICKNLGLLLQGHFLRLIVQKVKETAASTKFCNNQIRWIQCEVEALHEVWVVRHQCQGLAVPVHWANIAVQSLHCHKDGALPGSERSCPLCLVDRRLCANS